MYEIIEWVEKKTRRITLFHVLFPQSALVIDLIYTQIINVRIRMNSIFLNIPRWWLLFFLSNDNHKHTSCRTYFQVVFESEEFKNSQSEKLRRKERANPGHVLHWPTVQNDDAWKSSSTSCGCFEAIGCGINWSVRQTRADIIAASGQVKIAYELTIWHLHNIRADQIKKKK